MIVWINESLNGWKQMDAIKQRLLTFHTDLIQEEQTKLPGVPISTVLIRFSELNEKWRNKNHKNKPKKTKITFCWPAWTTSSAPCKSHMTKSHDEHVIGWKGEVQERGRGQGRGRDKEAGKQTRTDRHFGNDENTSTELWRRKKNRTKTKWHKQKNQEKQKHSI